MEARALARTGDVEACDRAMGAAVRALRAPHIPATDPDWISYFDDAELAAELGHCYRDLGRPTRPSNTQHGARSSGLCAQRLLRDDGPRRRPPRPRRHRRSMRGRSASARPRRRVRSARCVEYVRAFRQQLGEFEGARRRARPCTSTPRTIRCGCHPQPPPDSTGADPCIALCVFRRPRRCSRPTSTDCAPAIAGRTSDAGRDGDTHPASHQCRQRGASGFPVSGRVARPARSAASVHSGREPFSYCRDSAMRISLSVSVMRSPLTSTVTVCRVPVNRNGDW